MIQTRVVSFSFDGLLRRVIKLIRYSKKDVVQARQVGPYGIDSSPIPQLVAIYSGTGSVKDCVIVGYILPNQLAQAGEVRLYSTDQDGNVKNYIWLKNDGTIHFGGDQGHLTRFEQLKTGFDNLVTDFNNHSHASNGVPPTVPSTADISDAKIEDFLTL